MNPFFFLAALGLSLCFLPWANAQDRALTLDEVIAAGRQWAEENLDDSVLEWLDAADQTQVQQFFLDLQERLAGEYVVDLAALNDLAIRLVPLLERSELTQPYAVWLKTRLDYLAVADEFRVSLSPAKPPGEPSETPRAHPGPQFQRKAWKKQLAQKPPPTKAEQCVARLRPIFAAERVPRQLVWLAEVESSFDPLARSPADAVGLFQLRPATAQQLGLSLRPEDERLQPDKSAKAAAQYLRYLHGKFKDWPLTLAAYNAGEGRVQSLLERHRKRSFEGIASHLPAETQLYVPKVDATLARREGIRLAQLSPAQPSAPVTQP